MTDGEPEPFLMPIDEDDDDASADDAATTEASADTPDPAADDSPLAALPVESIADLIDEASKTAAEQAVQAAIGEAPEDRSADVWGPADDDTEAVWSAAAEHRSGRRVFDDAFGTDDAWSDGGERQVSPAADPNVSLDASPDEDEDDEPEVYTFPVADEPAVVAADDLAAAMVTPGATPAEADEADAADDEEAEDPLAVLDEVIDDEDSWADQAWSDRVEEADAAAAEPVVETPEPFRFAAGPGITAPAEVPDHTAANDEREPDAFSFAFDEGAAEAAPDSDHDAGTAFDGALDDAVQDADALWDTSDVGEAPETVWEEPSVADASAVWEDEGRAAADDVGWSAGADETGDGPMVSDEQDGFASGEPEDDAPWSSAASDDQDVVAGSEPDDAWSEPDDAWSFDVSDEDVAAQAPAEDSLAATATPRPDTGWNDLEDEQHTWTLPGAPTRPADGDEEPDGFVSVVDDLDDDVGAAPAAAGDEPEPVVLADAEELQGALGELLGATPPDADPEPFEPADEPFAPAAPAAAFDPLDDLDDLDDVLADLDGLDAPVAGAPPTADTAPSLDDAPPPSLDDAPPPFASAPPPAFADSAPPVAAAPPPAHAAPADDAEPVAEDTAADEPDEEPAPQPTPGGLTFSSAKKGKKRGLFG